MSATEVGASIARLRETIPSLTDSVEDAQKSFDNAVYRVRVYVKKLIAVALEPREVVRHQRLYQVLLISRISQRNLWKKLSAA